MIGKDFTSIKAAGLLSSFLHDIRHTEDFRRGQFLVFLQVVGAKMPYPYYADPDFIHIPYCLQTPRLDACMNSRKRRTSGMTFPSFSTISMARLSSMPERKMIR